jgi:hypothetical protein
MSDEKRTERLTALARKAWLRPGSGLMHIHQVDIDWDSDDQVTSARVLQVPTMGSGRLEVLASIWHPNALDALEAALLVLNGPESLREFAYGVVAMEKPEPAWTTQPPSAEGYYWCKRHPFARAYVYEVVECATGYRCIEDDFDVTELGHLWIGPMERPL